MTRVVDLMTTARIKEAIGEEDGSTGTTKSASDPALDSLSCLEVRRHLFAFIELSNRSCFSPVYFG